MYTYAQPFMQNQPTMMQQNSMYMDSSYNSYSMMSSYPNYNTTNIYNNFFGQPNYMVPQTTQMPTMFQGQMIGGQGMPTIYQGQTISAYPTVSQMIPQMPMQQPSFGLDQVMGLLMGMMQMMFSGGFSIGENVVVEETLVQDPLLEEVLIDSARAWGDPHYKFKDKTGKDVTIDHKGTDGETYNALNADGLDIDAEYKHHGGSKPQDIGAVRVKAGNQELIINKGKAALDGKELAAGEYTLADGRTINVQKNGSVDISTKSGNGTISIDKDGGRYEINTKGQVGVNTGIDNGGILGFLATQGQNNSKDEILAEWDQNGNGILDDGDQKIVNMFRTTDDIGIYQY